MVSLEQPEDVKLLSISDTARLLGKSEDWLRKKISRGEGPPARRVSANRLCIFHRELLQWLDALEQVGRPRLYAHPDPELTIDVTGCAEEGK
jgi:hypothetical protein